MNRYRHFSARGVAQPKLQQRGVASLVVVMVLFFIVSLVAAYTSRNLIFEQRTSANHYRSTQAFEAAEAGLDWALALLNGGRVTSNCQEGGAVASDSSFRRRYLGVATDTTGLITPVRRSGGTELWPSCVFDGNTSWECHCPVDEAPLLTTPEGSGVFPAFRVRFTATGITRPGVIRIQSNGCTRLEDGCLDFPAQGATGEGRATLSTLVVLKSAISTPPAAALTLGGALLAPTGGASLKLTNADPGTTGVTVQSASTAAISPADQVTLLSLPGVPPEASVIENDVSLAKPALVVSAGPPAIDVALTSADRFFVSFFNAHPESYRLQPATVELDCSGGCSSTAVNAIHTANPDRIVWARGAGTLTVDVDMGTASEPVLLIVEGNLVVTGDPIVTGFIYSRNPAWIWSVTGGFKVVGAVAGEGSFNVQNAASTSEVIYDGAVLTRLRRAHGSFVRVPGGWRDFP